MLLDAKYAYLALTMAFLVVWFGLFALSSYRARRHQIMRSIVAMPMGPIFEVLFFRDYWRPESVFVVNILTIPVLLEDLLFAFAIVGIGSVSYETIFGKVRIRSKEISLSRRVLIISLLMGASYGITWTLVWYGGINSIFASALALAIPAAASLARRRDLLPVAAFTSLFFTAVLSLIYSLGLLCFANADAILKGWWLLFDQPLGIRLWRIPATEIVWAIAYGFACPVVYAAATGVEYR